MVYIVIGVMVICFLCLLLFSSSNVEQQRLVDSTTRLIAGFDSPKEALTVTKWGGLRAPVVINDHTLMLDVAHGDAQQTNVHVTFLFVDTSSLDFPEWLTIDLRQHGAPNIKVDGETLRLGTSEQLEQVTFPPLRSIQSLQPIETQHRFTVLLAKQSAIQGRLILPDLQRVRRGEVVAFGHKFVSAINRFNGQMPSSVVEFWFAVCERNRPELPLYRQALSWLLFEVEEDAEVLAFWDQFILNSPTSSTFVALFEAAPEYARQRVFEMELGFERLLEITASFYKYAQNAMLTSQYLTRCLDHLSLESLIDIPPQCASLYLPIFERYWSNTRTRERLLAMTASWIDGLPPGTLLLWIDMVICDEPNLSQLSWFARVAERWSILYQKDREQFTRLFIKHLLHHPSDLQHDTCIQPVLVSLPYISTRTDATTLLKRIKKYARRTMYTNLREALAEPTTSNSIAGKVMQKWLNEKQTEQNLRGGAMSLAEDANTRGGLSASHPVGGLIQVDPEEKS